MGYTLRYARKVNLAAMTPQGELASTGFCLAEPGKEYLVYLPEGGEVTVDLSAVSGAMAVEWFHPRSGDTTQGQSTSGGRKRSFQAAVRRRRRTLSPEPTMNRKARNAWILIVLLLVASVGGAPVLRGRERCA